VWAAGDEALQAARACYRQLHDGSEADGICHSLHIMSRCAQTHLFVRHVGFDCNCFESVLLY